MKSFVILVLALVCSNATAPPAEHSRFRRKIEKTKVKVGESAFLENFQTFVADQSILVPSNLPNGNHKFKFDARNDHAKTLVVDDAAGPIQGYLLQASADSQNQIALPANEDNYYMFTALLSGCQFMAYGPDNRHVTVEHNNCISSPCPAVNDAGYEGRLAAVRAENHPFIWVVSGVFGDRANEAAAPNAAGDGYTYGNLYGGQVVGKFTQAGGWVFTLRDNTMGNNGAVYHS